MCLARSALIRPPRCRLWSSAPPQVGVLFQQKPFVQPFLQQLGQDSTTADTANWASQMIQKSLRG